MSIAQDAQAVQHFVSALNKGRVQVILSRLQMQRSDLLSFYDVKSIVKPKNQTYVGTRPIPIDKIIGSENRYTDFNRAFLPKKMMLKGRWTRIDAAHQQMVELPPISVYQLGDAYFVRDGNHRVSVARITGVEFIDADIVALDSEIPLKPGMTNRQIKRQVLVYERNRVIEETGIEAWIDMETIRFTETGRYTEMIHHINVHREFLRRTQGLELTFEQGVRSWYEDVYLPIAEAVQQLKTAAQFPGRSTADLYMWIVKHWNRMKGRTGRNVLPGEAAADYADTYGRDKLSGNLVYRLHHCLRRIFQRKRSDTDEKERQHD